MINSFFLVDDDKDDTELFADALKELDLPVEFNFALNCQDLTTGLLQDKFNPQIIFLDINMPGMSGWQCLEAIKHGEKTRDIPVIMYSTSSAILDGRRAIQRGALGFYEKPSRFEWLKEFLEMVAVSSPGTLRSTLKKLEGSKIHRIYLE